MNAPEILTASADRLVLTLDKSLYPLDVVYGAAYVFIDRAYVLLGRSGEAVTVEIAPKAPTDEAAARALAGEFGNELLSQALRRQITEANKSVLEAIVSQAFAGATGMAAVPTAFTDDADDDLDFLDDPLGIAVPWEEKFKKSGSAAAGATEERPPAASPEQKADEKAEEDA